MFKTNKFLKLAVLALISMFFLVACGTNESKDTTSGSGDTAEDDSEKLVFGVKFDTKLFGLKNTTSGDVEGFDIDIAKLLAKEVLGDETKIELVEVTSKTRIPLLNKGDIDAIIATMTITEERKNEVDFTDVYFEAGQSLLVKKGSEIKSIEDLTKDTTVLAVKGSTSTDNIRKVAPDAQVLEFENYAEAFTALKAGKGDTLTTDNSILLGMVTEDDSFELVGGTFTDEPYGIAVKKGNKDLLDKLNKALETIHSNGEFDKVYDKWFE